MIDDSERDIACAKTGVVKVFAQATGTLDAASLAAYQPDALLLDLSDGERLIETLLSL